MTGDSASSRAERQDISVAAVWIACGLLLLVPLLFVLALHPEYLRGELGVLETAQNIFLAVALGLTIHTYFQADDVWLKRWLIVVGLGTFYLLGEEMSWGQHYFRWAVGGFFGSFNDQGETNFHNSSSWLDQKPRAILLLGMIVGGVIHPLVKYFRKGRGLIDNPWWLAPTMASLPPVIFSQIGALPKRIDHLHLLDFSLEALTGINRPSEMEEYFMYVFFLTYMLSLRFRMKLKKAGKL